MALPGIPVTHLTILAALFSGLLASGSAHAMEWKTMSHCANSLRFRAQPLASSNMATIELLKTEDGAPVAHLLKRKVNGVWLERIALRGFESLELKRVEPGLISHALGQAEETIVQELRVGTVDYRVVDSYRFQSGNPGLWVWQKSTLYRIEKSVLVPQN